MEDHGTKLEELNRKLEEKKNDVFMIEMQDHWENGDAELIAKYNDEIRQIRKEIEELENGE